MFAVSQSENYIAFTKNLLFTAVAFSITIIPLEAKFANSCAENLCDYGKKNKCISEERKGCRSLSKIATI